MIQLDEYLLGRGQPAGELPASWECYTRAELESIIADMLKGTRKPEDQLTVHLIQI